MEKQFKMRISRMFRSYFESCRAQNWSDVVEKAVVSPKHSKGFQEVEPKDVSSSSSPKACSFSSMCRPEKTSETVHGSCIKSLPKDSFLRKKVSEMSSDFSWGGLDSRSHPPASATSPLNPFSHRKQFGFVEEAKNIASRTNARKNDNKKKKKKVSEKRTKSMEFFPFSSSSMYSSLWWYNSDDQDDEGEYENEIDTLFSYKSRTSISSSSGRKKQRSRRGRRWNKSTDMDVLPLSGKLEDSFAVVKKSSDPYSDFRTSMVEMITERQISSPSELQNLLQCFLSLNSHHHHKTIVEVFMEISEAFFSDCHLC